MDAQESELIWTSEKSVSLKNSCPEHLQFISRAYIHKVPQQFDDNIRYVTAMSISERRVLQTNRHLVHGSNGCQQKPLLVKNCVYVVLDRDTAPGSYRASYERNCVRNSAGGNDVNVGENDCSTSVKSKTVHLCMSGGRGIVTKDAGLKDLEQVDGLLLAATVDNSDGSVISAETRPADGLLQAVGDLHGKGVVVGSEGAREVVSAVGLQSVNAADIDRMFAVDSGAAVMAEAHDGVVCCDLSGSNPATDDVGEVTNGSTCMSVPSVDAEVVVADKSSRDNGGSCGLSLSETRPMEHGSCTFELGSVAPITLEDNEMTRKLGEKRMRLLGEVEKLRTWANDTKEVLATADADKIRAMSADVLKQYDGELKQKRKELERIKKSVNSVPVNRRDDDLRAQLAAIHSQLHNINQEICQQAASSAALSLDEFDLSLNNGLLELDSVELTTSDPDVLQQQLADYKICYDDVIGKCEHIKDFSSEFLTLLHEARDRHSQNVASRLEALYNKADNLIDLSHNRMLTFEDAVPLATNFQKLRADLESTFSDILPRLDAIQIPSTKNVEIIRTELREAKATSELISQQKLPLNELVEISDELSKLVTCDEVLTVADELSGTYKQLCADARQKTGTLNGMLQSAITDLADVADSCLDALYDVSDQVCHLDDVACSVDVIAEQIAETKAAQDDLQACSSMVDSIEKLAAKLKKDESFPDGFNFDEKLEHINGLQSLIKNDLNERLKKLELAEEAAIKYEQAFSAISGTLHNVQETVANVASDADLVQQLQCAKEELEKCPQLLAECKKASEQLESVCSASNYVKVKKQVNDLESDIDNLRNELDRTEADLKMDASRTENCDNICQTIFEWLPQAENSVNIFAPIAADQRTVRIQIEELKAFTRQLYPHYSEIKNLNDYADMMKKFGVADSETITKVAEVNKRWIALLEKVSDREAQLSDTLVELGEMDQAMDDVIGLLQEAESDLQKLDCIYGDPNLIEVCLDKVQTLQNGINSQQPIIRKLNATIKKMIEQSGNQKSSNLSQKLEEMNETFQQTKTLALEKSNVLQDRLSEAKVFMGGIDALMKWLIAYGKQLKMAATPGALPESAQAELDKFALQQNKLHEKIDEVKALLLNGQDIVSRCRDEDAQQLKDKLQQLHKLAAETLTKSNKHQEKLEEHLCTVVRFHTTLGQHNQWIAETEIDMNKFSNASKLVETVQKQIADHKAVADNIDAHKEMTKGLDVSGTYLKYFGRKRDSMIVQGRLFETKMRWKRLLLSSTMKGRHLLQALHKDKWFHDNWKSLCDWLENKTDAVSHDAGNISVNSIEEFASLVKKLQFELDSKHPLYFLTLRLGRLLRDCCTANDPEKGVVMNMINQLKNEWMGLKSLVSHKGNEVCEMLASLKKLSDAAAVICDNLRQIDTALGKNRPLYGDVHMIRGLIAEHGETKKWVAKLCCMADALKESPELQSDMKEQLENVMFSVNERCQLEDDRLKEALQLAEEFHNATCSLADWIHSTTSKLSESDLPDDEEKLLHLIEDHKELEKQICDQQTYVDKLKDMSEIILSSCHPNSVKAIKYSQNVTEADWHKLKKLVDNRKQSLNNALENARCKTSHAKRVPPLIVEPHSHVCGKLNGDCHHHRATPVKAQTLTKRIMPALKHASVETVKIHDTIEQHLQQCCCATRYPVQRIADGKYKFGEKGKLCLVRFLNSTVMVRVGGGWVTLAKFLEGNDPCRAKGRINSELREHFVLPEGASQSQMGFHSRRSYSLVPGEVARAASVGDISERGMLKAPLKGAMKDSGRWTPPTSLLRPSGSRSSLNSPNSPSRSSSGSTSPLMKDRRSSGGSSSPLLKNYNAGMKFTEGRKPPPSGSGNSSPGSASPGSQRRSRQPVIVQPRMKF